MTLFDGFATHDLDTERGTIHAVVGGEGPPLLLLHGYPETHLMWHAVAVRLAHRFTVVAADLPGYGDSFRPAPAEDHIPHSKRAMAVDMAQAMASLGYERFAVAGHDRGGRVAYRMALDHPDTVTRLAVLDIVPTAEVWSRADDKTSLLYWHWGFLAQPPPLPEELMLAAPDAFFEHHVRRHGVGGVAGHYPDEVVEAYRRQLRDPPTVQSICEDYRAGASIDRERDNADRTSSRTIDCRTLALWGTRGALELFYGDILEVWRPWAPAVTGHSVEASHFVPEDAPDEVSTELTAFFAARD